MSLYAILLNSTDIDGIYDLYEQIIHVYGDPLAEESSARLSNLLSSSAITEAYVDPYMQESDVAEGENNTQDFMDETDTTTDPIIHQSPFNVKACDRMPALRMIINKEKLPAEPSNPLFSPKIIHLFHKWFAYLPLWSCVLTNFFDRYIML